jgi:protein involved in polysaccharide export with SLBB domain
MIKNLKRYISFFLLFTLVGTTISQVTPDQARARLEQRGIDEEELANRLKAKGVNIDELNGLTPAELVQFQSVVEETIDEIEADRKRVQTNQSDEKEQEETAFPAIRRLDTFKIDTISMDSIILSDTLAVLNIDDDSAASRIYGQHLFINRAIPVYSSESRILPNAAYILGTGDEIAISIYGQSQFEGSFEIDRAGYIYPSRLPRIFLKGLKLSEARIKLQKVFENYYRFASGEFNTQVSAIRNVTIGVFGNAERIGSYSLPAQNTVFNAIAAAGGPDRLGSVRKIRLHRGEEIKYVDLYAFMSNPATAQDYYLEDNDIIQIPEATKVVSIKGEIRKPFVFELFDQENLIDLLRYAGGLTDKAYLDNIQIKRKSGDSYRIHDVNLADILARGGDYQLQPGDEIDIRAIRGALSQIVYIEGSVNYPGQFNLENNMTIADLIQRGGLNNQSRKDFALLSRLSPDSTYLIQRLDLRQIIEDPKVNDNVILKEGDRLQIFSTSDFKNNYTFVVEGNVRQPGTFPLDARESLKVSDAILLSGGVNPNVYEKGMILRTPVDNSMNKEWITFNIVNALGDPNSTDNLFLEPQDKLFIYSNDNFDDAYQLSTDGAVRTKMTTPYGDGIRVSDIIIMSDGLRPDASDKGYVVRNNLKNQNEEFYIPVNIISASENPGGDEDILLSPGDRLFVFSTTDLTDKFLVNIEGEIRNPGEYIYAPSMSLRSILLLAGGLKFSAATNRVEIFRLIFDKNNPVKKSLISVELDQDLNIVGNEDIKLEPFDIVVVRRIPGFELHEKIQLVGEFTYPGVYSLLNDNERITDLIERSGGFTREAFLPAAKLYRNEDEKGYVVIRLDEIMRNQNSAMNIRLKAGDRIIVPKSEELVVIKGSVDLESAVQDEIAKEGKVNVAFIGRKRAMHYINQFTGGLKTNTSKKYIKVKYPNGAINKTKRFLFFTTTPRVDAGSEIIVDSKPPELEKKEEEENERTPVDWGKVVSNSIAQAGAILSLILLLQQVD